MNYVKQMCRLLVVMLVVVACSGASIGFAQDVARGDSFVNDSYRSSSEQVDWKDPNHVKTLTRDEFMNQLMSLKHISLLEAVKLDAQTRIAFERNNPQAAAAITTDSGHWNCGNHLLSEESLSVLHLQVFSVSERIRSCKQ